MTGYKTRTVACTLAIAGALWMVPPVAIAAQNTSTHTVPDNTRANKNTAAPTADNAKNSMSDREMMAKIRREVVKDKSLSTYGHNVKIISEHGKVTLRGPVKSDEEKKTIEALATKVAGDGNVSNEISVKGASK